MHQYETAPPINQAEHGHAPLTNGTVPKRGTTGRRVIQRQVHPLPGRVRQPRPQTADRPEPEDATSGRDGTSRTSHTT